jgi:hypothetical protein
MVDVAPAMELMTIVAPRGAPSLAEAARHFGVATEDVDSTFGVVPVDPVRGLYAVRVRASKLPAQAGGAPSDYHGPFSDPKIAPFGPVQEDKKNN